MNLPIGVACPKGRKHDPLYQTELMRDCRSIRERVTNHVRLYQIMTRELRPRFSHLLARHDFMRETRAALLQKQ